MGTASTNKFVKISGDQEIEEAALLTSAGAGDANRIPALGATGVLDSTILNGTTTSAGAGSSGKTVLLDAGGLIDESMLPIGYDLASVIASEALSAGNLVNLYNNAGVLNMRKADAGSNKPAGGFVKAAVSALATGTVYTEGRITGLTGLTVGQGFLGTAGAIASTGATAAGALWQPVGKVISATQMIVDFDPGVVRA